MRLPESTSRIQRAAFPWLLLAAVVAVYANTLAVPFLLDDLQTIPGNPSITRLSPISSVLFPPPHVYSAGRPVLNLSYALNHAVGGLHPTGYHVANIAIHAAATLVLFGVVRRTLALLPTGVAGMRHANLTAFFVALLWAVHPLQTVSVTYVSQRAESLMGLFHLLTLYCFIRSLGPGVMLWRIASVLSCVLGMATKEVMVTAPVLVFLFDATCVARSFKAAWSTRWRYHLALAATWLVLAALMLNSELGRRGVGEQGLTWFEYARIECLALGRYLKLAVWPAPLVFDYGANVPVPSWPELIIPGLVVLGLLGFAIRQLARCRPSGFLAFSFFLLLAPTSSIVPVAGQPIAENRMYLPLALVVASTVIGCGTIAGRHTLPLAAAAGIALAVHARDRNEDFQSPLRIWTDTLAKQPVNDRGWVYLSEALKAIGQQNAAANALLTGLRHRPNSPELANNAAVALYSTGRPKDAIPYFETAIRLKPSYGEAYYNLGAVLYNTGNVLAALEHFRAHLRFNPQSVEAHNYAGLCLLQLGQPAAAVPHFQRATEIDPAHPYAPVNLQRARAEAAR